MAAEAVIADDPERLAAARTAMERAREVTTRGRQRLLGILDAGGVGDWAGTPGYLRSIAFAARLCRTPAILAAFRALALRVESHAGKLLHRPVPNSPHSFIFPLQQLAERQERWRRRPEEWRPKTGRADAQFSSLVNYLLPPEEATRFQREVMEALPTRRFATWFAHLDRGQNNRPDAPRALYVTRKIAAHFAAASEPYDYIRALRCSQVFGMGGDARLAQAVGFARLSWQLWAPSDEEWWATVLQWLAQNPALDPALVAPVIGFVHDRRFGVPAFSRAPDPSFRMKGRTLPAVVRLMEGWDTELASLVNYQRREFRPSGLQSGRYLEKNDGDPLVWTLEEILDSAALIEEGRQMRNCVATYLEQVAKRRCSIWSMKVRRGDLLRRAATVQVNSSTRRIVQCRGRCNRSLKLEERQILQRWARDNGLDVGSY